jgi:uncharacterized protein (TIGR03000 family)
MFRRIFTATHLATLAVLGSLLAAGTAAAQNQGYSVWAHRNGAGWTAPGYSSGPGNRYEGYRYIDALSDYSRYTDPYASGYGGRVNNDFTVTRNTAIPEPVRSPATIEVRLPNPQAQIAFDGHRTASRGSQRLYATPALKAGAEYYYDVTATWTEDGRQVKEDRRVKVTAGQVVTVDFARDVYTATDLSGKPAAGGKPALPPKP